MSPNWKVVNWLPGLNVSDPEIGFSLGYQCRSDACIRNGQKMKSRKNWQVNINILFFELPGEFLYLHGKQKSNKKNGCNTVFIYLQGPDCACVVFVYIKNLRLLSSIIFNQNIV